MLKTELLARWSNPIQVLDHGHVRLIDVMGDDERIEAVARLSYEGGRTKSDTRGLLRYLMRQRHTSPFEQAVITLDIKLPIFVARQLVRHRTQSLNEVSGRYSVLPEEFYVPEADQICYQAVDNKQGRSGPFLPDEAAQLQDQLRGGGVEAFADYHQYIEAGMAKETARLNLPLSTYTHWCTTWDLHNLLHMLELRLDSHAQWEIRVYAQAIWNIVQDWVPLSAEAFTDYRLEAETFSRQEMQILRVIMSDWKEYLETYAEGEGLKSDEWVKQFVGNLVEGLPKRERIEFLRKLRLT